MPESSCHGHCCNGSATITQNTVRSLSSWLCDAPVPAVVEVAHNRVCSALDDALQANRLALRILPYVKTVTGHRREAATDAAGQHAIPFAASMDPNEQWTLQSR